MTKHINQIQNLENKIQDLKDQLEKAEQEQKRLSKLQNWWDGTASMEIRILRGGGNDPHLMHLKIHDTIITLTEQQECNLRKLVEEWVRTRLDGKPARVNTYLLLEELENEVLNDLGKKDLIQEFERAASNLLTSIRNIKAYY